MSAEDRLSTQQQRVSEVQALNLHDYLESAYKWEEVDWDKNRKSEDAREPEVATETAKQYDSVSDEAALWDPAGWDSAEG